MIICGGAALNQNIINFFESIGVTILNGYGITECAPLISCNRNEYRKQGSVGLPIIGGHVKINNPDENGEGATVPCSLDPYEPTAEDIAEAERVWAKNEAAKLG